MNRLTIKQEWVGRNVVVQFQCHGITYRVPHDELVRVIGETVNYLNTYSWNSGGAYGTANPSRRLLDKLDGFVID